MNELEALRFKNTELASKLSELEKTAIKLIRQTSLSPDKSADTIIIDTETTGLDAMWDELLQVSIIDIDGNELYNSYIKPLHHQSWIEAEHVNHISPQMVRYAPTIFDEMPKINAILRSANTIIGYNTSFDLDFLYVSGGISVNDKNIVDVMDDFAEEYGEWDEQHDSYKWQKLSTAADHYGYDWNSRPEGAHNSLADCYATLFVYNKMRESEKINNPALVQAITDVFEERFEREWTDELPQSNKIKR